MLGPQNTPSSRVTLSYTETLFLYFAMIANYDLIAHKNILDLKIRLVQFWHRHKHAQNAKLARALTNLRTLIYNRTFMLIKTHRHSALLFYF